jgi:hypothetical protein
MTKKRAKIRFFLYRRFQKAGFCGRGPGFYGKNRTFSGARAA